MLSTLESAERPLNACFARVGVAEPDPRDKIGRDFFKGVEVFVQRQKDKDVLLRVRPRTLYAVIEQAADEFRNKVVLGSALIIASRSTPSARRFEYMMSHAPSP